MPAAGEGNEKVLSGLRACVCDRKHSLTNPVAATQMSGSRNLPNRGPRDAFDSSKRFVLSYHERHGTN